MEPVAPDKLSETERQVLARAAEVRQRAYAPYSSFRVGAAVLARDASGVEHVFTGCNVENASYGLTLCAERAAAAAAVPAGARDLIVIGISTATKAPTPPCGACRQFLVELAPALRVLIACEGASVCVTSLDRLLPDAFGGAGE